MSCSQTPPLEPSCVLLVLGGAQAMLPTEDTSLRLLGMLPCCQHPREGCLGEVGDNHEWVPVGDDLLHVNKTRISQPALLTLCRGDEIPVGTYCSPI